MQKVYSEKRTFDATPEPPPEVEGDVDPATAPPGQTFVIHQHHARRLHFDLRLEMLNRTTPVLVSWAIPKNLPRRKGKPHLAVHVEDHPFEYGSFSGTIPKGNYGAGEVRIFDSGTYELVEQTEDKLTIALAGSRLDGVYHLIRPKKRGKQDEWLAFLREDRRPAPEDLPDLSPMLATLEREPFDDDRFLYEFKWDGVRALAVCSEDTVLMSRTRNDITVTYPELARLHDRLVALDAIVDGEIVALHEGRPSFERLQSRINLQNPRDIERAAKAVPVSYIAFDLLYLDGKRVLDRPVEERKRILDELVVPSDHVQVSPSVPGEGTSLFEVARERRLEGIVAKRLGSPYRPGKRTREWLKIKSVHDADVVIGGWTRGEGSRTSTFGALLVGAYSDAGLEFLGAVGTGFSEATLAALMPELERRAIGESPFVDEAWAGAVRFNKAIREPRWVTPELVARVEFRELTAAHRLRAPSFKGLRTDVDPGSCRLEDVAP